ncbi:MAG: hypothetical protein ACLGIR_11775 [Actinomycetes bacterium]|jgi:hypothetical protein
MRLLASSLVLMFALATVASAEPSTDEGSESGPAISAETLVPPHRGNTVHLRQPVQFEARGQDLDSASAEGTIRDLSTGVTARLALEADPESGSGDRVVFRSQVLELRPGGRYQATVRVSTYAGSVADMAWTFRHLPFEVRSTTAKIRRERGTVGEDGLWRFSPELQIGAFDLVAGETEHSGFGPVGQVVSLENAVVSYRLPGVGEPVSKPAYPSGTAVTVYKQVQILRGEKAPLDKRYAGQTVGLGRLALALPSGAHDAELSLKAVETSPFVPAMHCRTPDVGWKGCTTDPLRFYTPEDFAGRILDARATAETRRAEQEGPDAMPVPSDMPVFLTSLVHPPTAEYNWVTQDTPADELNALWHWEPILPAFGEVREPHIDHDEVCLGELIDCIDVNCEKCPTVEYQGTVVPEQPHQFTALCDAGYPCNALSVLADGELLNRCASPAGYNWAESGWSASSDCQQQNVFFYLSPPYQTGTNRIGASVINQIGYSDDWQGQGSWYRAYDELGFYWEDGAGWSTAGESWQAYVIDHRWCDGDEMQWRWSPSKWHHHVRFGNASGHGPYWWAADPVRYFIGPNGIAFNGFRQYEWTEERGGSTNSLGVPDYWCAEPNTARNYPYPIDRIWDAISRTTSAHLDADLWTIDEHTNGQAVASWAHIWHDYTYEWSPGISAGSGGPGVGFSLNPYRRERSWVVHYAFNYGF